MRRPTLLVLLALLVGLMVVLAAAPAWAAWHIETPKGHQRIGGKKFEGPYPTRAAAEEVNRRMFHGLGRVFGSDAEIKGEPSSEVPFAGFGVITIENSSKRTLSYRIGTTFLIKAGNREKWGTHSIAPRREHVFHYLLPVKFRVSFDHMDADGYQEKLYRLDHATSMRVPPKHADGKRYKFVAVRGGVDLRSVDAAGMSRREIMERANREHARSEARRRRKEARERERESIVKETERFRRERQVAEHRSRWHRWAIAAERVNVENLALLRRLVRDEVGKSKRTLGQWRKGVEGVTRWSARRSGRSDYTILDAAQIIKARAEEAKAARPKTPKFPKLARGGSARLPIRPTSLRTWQRLKAKPPAKPSSKASDTSPMDPRLPVMIPPPMTELQSKRKVEQQAMAKAWAESRRLGKLASGLPRPSDPQGDPEVRTGLTRISRTHEAITRQRARLAEKLADLLVKEFGRAGVDMAEEWLPSLVSDGLKRDVKEITEAARARLAGLNQYMHSWNLLRKYVTTLKEHLEPNGLFATLLEAMDPTLVLPGAEEFAADVGDRLDRAFHTFDKDISRLVLPAQARGWTKLWVRSRRR